MEIVIVSKTRMGKGKTCIGGITFPHLQSVRLLNKDGSYQSGATEFEIGQTWDIDFQAAPKIIKPHTEDIHILSKKKLTKKQFNNYDWLVDQKQIKDRVWRGSAKELFNKLVKWTGNRNGYISKPNVPEVSTGFWIPDKELKFSDKHFTYRSDGLIKQNFNLAYVGFEKPIESIEAGTIVRISLAKWWRPEDADIEERCYLQLSGWYE